MQAEAEIVFFSPGEGGRPVMPEGSGYAPHGCAVGGSEYLPIRIVDIPSDARFDRPFEAMIDFIYSDTVDYSPLFEAGEFELREGPKVVGVATLR